MPGADQYDLPDEEAVDAAQSAEQAFLDRSRSDATPEDYVRATAKATGLDPDKAVEALNDAVRGREKSQATREDRTPYVLKMLEDRFSFHQVTDDERSKMDGVRMMALAFTQGMAEMGLHEYVAFGEVIEDIDRAVQKMNASIARKEF